MNKPFQNICFKSLIYIQKYRKWKKARTFNYSQSECFAKLFFAVWVVCQIISLLLLLFPLPLHLWILSRGILTEKYSNPVHKLVKDGHGKLPVLEIFWLLKFIYSEKATKFSEISTLFLSYVVPVKSKVDISQNFVAFSEYINFSRSL